MIFWNPSESSSDFLELLYASEKIVEQDIFVRNNPEENNNLLSFIQSSMLFLKIPLLTRNQGMNGMKTTIHYGFTHATAL